MIDPTIKITRFWKELKRRKIVAILIAYMATTFAIIEFLSITSDTFNIPDGTTKLMYYIAAIALPFVILIPWIVNRKKEEGESGEVEATAPETKTEPAKTEPGSAELHNLPAQVTNFIGREKEVPVVRQMISEHRLVTLVGAGGCGKTRLACEVVTLLLPDFKDGTWFVDLSPITDENLVAKELTEVLKIPEVPNQPIMETLIEKIKKLELLIILDNCEHLVKVCAEVAGKLVQSVPGLKILATSRESLGINGENVWRVPSLTLLDPKSIIDVKDAMDSEAVMMFTDRARMNNPEFELEPANVNEVVTICNKLDGIPLALELVASRTRHMNTKVILDRFADRFDQLSSADPGTSKRQQTLQATIEWSYNLLSEEEKILFARLTLFSGGFDLEAAEAICPDEVLPGEEIINLLSKLIDRSLIYTVKGPSGDLRYKMLETLGQFAERRLADYNDEKVRNRFFHYYLEMGETFYEEQFELQLNWLKRLEAEQENIMVALNWSEEHYPEGFIRLSGSLAWFWRWESHFITGKDYLERAIKITKIEDEAHARLLAGMGLIYSFTGELEEGQKALEESLEIFTRKGNQFGEAIVLSYLSDLYKYKKDYDSDIKCSTKSLEIAKKIGKPGLINHGLSYVCQSLVHSKQFTRSKPFVEELLESSLKLNQPTGILYARHFMGDIALGEKDYRKTEELYAEAMQTGLEFGDVVQAAFDMQGIAFALSGQGRLAKALHLNAIAVHQAMSCGINPKGLIEFWDEWIEEYIEGAKSEVGEELARKYEEEGRAMGFDKAVEYALNFEKD